MTEKSPILQLDLLEGEYAISRLPQDADVPLWARGTGCVSITIADEELSIVCRAERVPEDVEGSRGWRAIKVTTKFDLDAPGVVLSAIRPISEAGLGVFVVSTYYRDYILVRADELLRVATLQRAAGHIFNEQAARAGD